MIVLFTDFGLHGPHTGQMKAVLQQMAPGVPAIDLFADAPVGNLRRRQAACPLAVRLPTSHMTGEPGGSASMTPWRQS